MKSKSNPKFKNQLALFRRRQAVEQKQISVLLGHKTTDQISRYERGVKVPDLKTALKLGILYKIPIRVLLDGYFEACREEMRRQEGIFGDSESPQSPSSTNRADKLEFCTIERKLKRKRVERTDLDKAARHCAHLIRRRAEKMGHVMDNGTL